MLTNDTNDLLNSYLKIICKNLGFSYTERISIYKVSSNRFVLLGRSSENPNFSVSGRSNYPLKEGFIGLGWERGEYYIADLPDPSSNFETYYERVSNENTIDRLAVNNIKMKSRSYFIHRVDGFDSNPKAIIVFESIQPEGIDKEKVKNFLSENLSPLVTFVEKINFTNVKYSEASDLGY